MVGEDSDLSVGGDIGRKEKIESLIPKPNHNRCLGLTHRLLCLVELTIKAAVEPSEK